MIPRNTLLALALVASALSCAYYNGLYNARQLASQARVAEREGRRGEARSLWIQAAVKAESVVARHPQSKYLDDALMLQGLALARLGDCRDAVRPLTGAINASADPGIRMESRLLLADCWLEMGFAELSREALRHVSADGDSALASRVRYMTGRAWLVSGEPDSALAYLNRSAEEGAQYERAVAYLALGQVREAAVVIDSTRTLGYREAEWERVLRTIGGVDYRIASALVDRLRQDGNLTAGQEARLLIADGVRWVPIDPARARSRLAEAGAIAGDSLESGIARGHWWILEFQRSSDVDRIPEFLRAFEDIMSEGGPAVAFVAPFALVLDELVVDLETGGPTAVRLFRRAEEVRDSLLAPPMAGRLFGEVVNRNPESTIAPKALLAMASLRPSVADSVVAVLTRRYADSPYTQLIRGLPAPGFTAVEDSLRVLLDQAALPQLSPRPGRAGSFSRSGLDTAGVRR